MPKLPLRTLAALALAAGCGGSSPPPGRAEAPAAAAPVSVPDPAPTPVSEAAPKRAPGGVPAAIREAVDASERSAEDRALDAGRKPAETLAFFGIAPGQRVAEIAAGGGYTAELLARVVGEGGKVHATNNRFVLEKFAEKPLSARLEKPVMRNVVRVDREFDDPLPPEAKDLDAVLLVLFYHDTFWMKTDRQKMLGAIFASLKPGGVFGVVDHSAREGSGAADVKTLHRVEEKLVREEVERAGFRLAGEASFLRNPEDARDWNAAPSASAERRGTSDRFVLRFEKPR